MRDVNYLLRENVADQDILSTHWNLVEENNTNVTECDFFGIHIDESAKDCYINHIKLPQGCHFESEYFFGHLY